MCDGIVIDAHLMPEIRSELARDNGGTLYKLIDWFLQNCGMVVTPIIENHWRTKISDRDPLFWTWYSKQIENGSIHSINPKKLDAAIKSKLRAKYKLPKDIYVFGYLECAHATAEPKYILAEDMYFYDPTARSQATKTQIKLRESRNGALCRYIETQLKIRVGTPTDCASYFPVVRGPCSCKLNANQGHCSKVT